MHFWEFFAKVVNLSPKLPVPDCSMVSPYEQDDRFSGNVSKHVTITNYAIMHRHIGEMIK